MVNELLARLTHHRKYFSQNPVTETQLGALIDMVNDHKITGEHNQKLVNLIHRQEI